jgi:hypothetical protein
VLHEELADAVHDLEVLVDEEGPDHQLPAPVVLPPEDLPDLTASLRRNLHAMPEQARRFWERDRPFEFRSVEAVEEGKPRPAIVVIGNSTFATNAFVNFPGNSDFFRSRSENEKGRRRKKTCGSASGTIVASSKLYCR